MREEAASQSSLVVTSLFDHSVVDMMLPATSLPPVNRLTLIKSALSPRARERKSSSEIIVLPY